MKKKSVKMETNPTTYPPKKPPNENFNAKVGVGASL
jgi:hypothetical protein